MGGALPEGTVDQNVYLDVLKDTLGKAHWATKYIWQQDGSQRASRRRLALHRRAEEVKWQWPPNRPRSQPDREPVELFVAPGGEGTPRKRSAAVGRVPASVEEPPL